MLLFEAELGPRLRVEPRKLAKSQLAQGAAPEVSSMKPPWASRYGNRAGRASASVVGGLKRWLPMKLFHLRDQSLELVGCCPTAAASAPG